MFAQLLVNHGNLWTRAFPTILNTLAAKTAAAADDRVEPALDVAAAGNPSANEQPVGGAYLVDSLRELLQCLRPNSIGPPSIEQQRLANAALMQFISLTHDDTYGINTDRRYVATYRSQRLQTPDRLFERFADHDASDDYLNFILALLARQHDENTIMKVDWNAAGVHRLQFKYNIDQLVEWDTIKLQAAAAIDISKSPVTSQFAV